MFQPRDASSQKEVAQVLAMAQLTAQSSILDLACGTGRHAKLFADHGHSVVGLDYNSGYLKLARQAAGKRDCRFVRGDMRSLGRYFSANTFDLCVSLFNSFGYFKTRAEDAKVIRQVFRSLKPGGRFVLNTINGDGAKARLKQPISNGLEPIPGVFMIDAANFRFQNKVCLGHPAWGSI